MADAAPPADGGAAEAPAEEPAPAADAPAEAAALPEQKKDAPPTTAEEKKDPEAEEKKEPPDKKTEDPASKEDPVSKGEAGPVPKSAEAMLGVPIDGSAEEMPAPAMGPTGSSETLIRLEYMFGGAAILGGCCVLFCCCLLAGLLLLLIFAGQWHRDANAGMCKDFVMGENNRYEPQGYPPADTISGEPPSILSHPGVFVTFGEAAAGNFGEMLDALENNSTALIEIKEVLSKNRHLLTEQNYVQASGKVYSYYDGSVWPLRPGEPVIGGTGCGGSLWGTVGELLVAGGYYSEVVFASVAKESPTLAELTDYNGRFFQDLYTVYMELHFHYNRVDAILMHQGETDASAGEPAQWATDFKILREHFVQSIGATRNYPEPHWLLAKTAGCSVGNLDAILHAEQVQAAVYSHASPGGNADHYLEEDCGPNQDQPCRLAGECNFTQPGLFSYATSWAAAISVWYQTLNPTFGHGVTGVNNLPGTGTVPANNSNSSNFSISFLETRERNSFVKHKAINQHVIVLDDDHDAASSSPTAADMENVVARGDHHVEGKQNSTRIRRTRTSSRVPTLVPQEPGLRTTGTMKHQRSTSPESENSRYSGREEPRSQKSSPRMKSRTGTKKNAKTRPQIEAAFLEQQQSSPPDESPPLLPAARKESTLVRKEPNANYAGRLESRRGLEAVVSPQGTPMDPGD
ncbi:unnamed protein product [Amoebophrya sp. A120]|nr:unnamed protein product [Amoebophrya sp. A120]|eukprot:GSA120T00005751001.1